MIRHEPLPADSLLHAFAARPGTYTDCFCTDVKKIADPAPLSRYIFLFFDSWVFRIERRILALSGKSQTGREDAVALAKGTSDVFAAWTVDARTDTDLLMTVRGTAIFTWLRYQDTETDTGACLYFGSGILPSNEADPTPRPAWPYRATFGAHRAYSKLLLGAAARDWERDKPLPRPT